MSTRGVVDFVFCIDASKSMQPCIDGVRKNILSFVQGLESGLQQQRPEVDLRLDFVAHSCGQNGPFRIQTMRRENMNLIPALYPTADSSAFFSTDVQGFEQALGRVTVEGDEATLIALDFSLDFPWRPRNKCHRVVVCMTDERFEDGTLVREQQDQLDPLIEKFQALGVILFLVAPRSQVYEQLAEIDKSHYQVVETSGDGLSTVNFAKVLEKIGRTMSVQSLQAASDPKVRRALFGQDKWTENNAPLTGE